MNESENNEMKTEHTEVCESSKGLKHSNLRRTSISKNTKRCYDMFDELDEEPFPRPKLQKFIHSASENNKADASTKSCTGDHELHFEVEPVSCEDAHSHARTHGLKTKGENCEHVTNTSMVLESKSESAKGTVDEHYYPPSGTNETGDNDSRVYTQDQNDRQEKGLQQKLDDSCRVLYIHSDQLITHCNRLPRIPDRAGMVHSLIESLGLLSFLQVAAPEAADEQEVMKFHSRDYIEYLQRISHQEDEEKIESEDAVQYGITYDCPVQEGVYECAALVAGATVTAAKALCEGKCHTAINWCGGWHHAQRSEASGFCYINDIVLGILTLRNKFSRVLYVDLDLHHGDGVENAFSTTPHVLTVSFHKHDTGFFPGSGDLHDVGSRGGKFYTVNVPMKDGLCDTEFFSVFRRVMTCVREAYDPEVIVCQCGADGLAGDPMASFNLSLEAYRHCLYFLMLWRLPMLLLGGGGYHHANTARCWASLTALTVGRKLPVDVPDHKYFTEYGPDYELTVQAGNRKDHNSLKDLSGICSIIRDNLQKIKGKVV